MFWWENSGPPKEIHADHRATIGLIVKMTHGKLSQLQGSCRIMGWLGDYVPYTNTVYNDEDGPKWNTPIEKLLYSPWELFKERLGNHLVEDVVEGFQMLGRERGWDKLKLRSESKSIHKKEDTVISFCLRISGI